jgi:FkbM family methyltransferase
MFVNTLDVSFMAFIYEQFYNNLEMYQNNRDLYNPTVDEVANDYTAVPFDKNLIKGYHYCKYKESNLLLMDYIDKMNTPGAELPTISNKNDIAVVTKIKNMAEFLDSLYSSLLNQTYKNWIWYILDNNSTDNLREKIKSYNDDRIRIIPLDNYLNSWKIMVEKINQDIIVVIDADDFITTNCLEEIKYCFATFNIDFYCGSSQKFDSNTNQLLSIYNSKYRPDTNDIYNTHPVAFKRLFGQFVLTQHHIEYPMTDDYEFVNLLRISEGKGIISPNVTYFYRTNDNKSLSTNSVNLTNYQLYPTWQDAEQKTHDKIHQLNTIPVNANIVEFPEIENPNIEIEFNSLVQHKFNINNLNIRIDQDNHEILYFVYYGGQKLLDVNYEIVICDIESDLPLFRFDMNVSSDSQYWANPYVGMHNLYDSYKQTMPGYRFKVYDKFDRFYGQKELRVLDNKFNLKYYYDEKNNPIVSYIDFVYNDIYNDFMKDSKIIIDAGANIGAFIQYAHMKTQPEKIIVIEPLIEHCENIKKPFSHLNNLEIINKALHNTNNEDITLWTREDETTTSSIIQINDFEAITVKTIDLKTVIGTLPKIDLLKLDVEGAEYDVFKDLEIETLKKIDKLIIEYHYNDIVERNLLRTTILDKLDATGYVYSETTDFKKLGVMNEHEKQGTIFAKKLKILAVHLKTNPEEEREINSEKSIKLLEPYGIEYISVVNKAYKDLPPRETCARPEDVQMEPGYYKLTPGHFGNFCAHKNGIIDNFTDDVDILLILECDAIITVDTEVFVQKIYQAYKHSKENNLVLWTFGPNYGFNIEEKSNYYIIDHFVECHNYMIIKESKQIIIDALINKPWDVFDLFIIDNLKKYNMGVFKGEPLSLQHSGISLLDKKMSYENIIGIKKI